VKQGKPKHKWVSAFRVCPTRLSTEMSDQSKQASGRLPKMFAYSTIISIRFYSGLEPGKDAKTRLLNEEVLITNVVPSELMQGGLL
jgi:hypothetical protein